MQSTPRERPHKAARAAASCSDSGMDEFEIFRRQSLHGGRTAVKCYSPNVKPEAAGNDCGAMPSGALAPDRLEPRPPRTHKLSLDNQQRVPLLETERKTSGKLPLASRRSADRLSPTHGRIAEVDSPTSPAHPHTPDWDQEAPIRLEDLKICHLNSVIKDTWSSDSQAFFCSKPVKEKPAGTKERSRSVPKAASFDRRDCKKPFAVAATYFVQVLGSASVGKSTLCSQFAGGSNDGDDEMAANDETEQDSEFRKSKRISVVVDGEESTLVFLHSVAHSTVEQISIISGVHAYLVVYAIDDRESFQFARAILEAILVNNDMKTVVVLVANKSDLARRKEVRTEDGKTLAARYSASLVETSATLQHHVEDLLLEVLRQIRLSIAKQTQFALQNSSENAPITADYLACCANESNQPKRGIFCSILRRISRHK